MQNLRNHSPVNIRPGRYPLHNSLVCRKITPHGLPATGPNLQILKLLISNGCLHVV